jgi:F-type H+-transporting ATPase subunit a
MGEEHVLAVTKLVNMLLGKPAAALLSFLHIDRIHEVNAQYPIPNFMAMELVLFLFAAVFFLWLKARISVDRPGATQQVMEMVLTNPMGLGIEDLLEDVVGHGASRYLPMLGTITLFVLMSNLLVLIPGFMSPTAEKTVPLACAVIVFIYYNRFGIGKHGAGGYAKTLLGPVPFIAPIMIIVETISHFARVLSLTVRLWANMMVAELIYVTFLGLTVALFAFTTQRSAVGYLAGVAPVAIPLALLLFHIFEAVLQAFIFTILPIVYLGLAVAEEH